MSEFWVAVLFPPASKLLPCLLDRAIISGIKKTRRKNGLAAAYSELPVSNDSKLLPIIRTKLYAPLAPSDLVSRNRLLEQMDKVLSVPLMLVSASAGYGKSVLVGDWISSRQQPAAWLALEESDSDLRQFLQYLLAALDTQFSSDHSEISELVDAPQLAPVPVLACHLLNYIDAIDETCTLVLDDYHHLDSRSAVHELIAILLEHPPLNMHLVIVTRRDPPLLLNLLRAAGRMAEIRLADLRFTAAETVEFLARSTRIAVNEPALENLQRELEGWAVGLRLVMLAVAQTDEPSKFLVGLRGGVPQAQEYLLNEVLAGFPSDQLTMLLKSSILDRFCGELLEEICRADDQPASSGLSGLAFVRRIQASNLFVISLGAEGQWFRYHHLFQALLQRQLQREFAADEVKELHARASAWLENGGDIGESVRHALVAGDQELAADIVERNRHARLEKDRAYVVHRWLNLLPANLVARRPDLLLARAWVEYFSFEVASIAAIVEQLDSLVDEASSAPLLVAELNYFRAFLAYWRGDGAEACRCAEEALRIFPKEREMIAGEILLYVVLGRLMAGESEAAREFLNAEKASLGTKPGNIYLTRVYAAESSLDLLVARPQTAAVAIDHLKISAQRSGSAYALGWAEFLLALSHFQAGRLEDAHKNFKSAAIHRNAVERKLALDILAGLALSCALMGRSAEALEALDTLHEFSHEVLDPQYTAIAESCRARVSLLLGEPEAAQIGVSSIAPEIDAAGLFLWVEEPTLTRARVKIVTGNEAELALVLESLDDLSRQLELQHNICQIIEVSVLRCVALAKLGRVAEAQAALRGAVAHGAVEGWIRPFLEMGQPVIDLLADMDIDPSARAFVQTVQESFTARLASPSPGEGGTQSDGPAAVNGVTGPAPSDLTNRELDILQLLSRRYQNKEIANKLFISTHTVNYHLKHIYQKLGVSSRRQAVSAAVEKGVLSAE